MSDLPPDPLRAIALDLAVFPLPAGGRQPAPGWQQLCSSDPITVRRQWNPGDNIGVGCRASGVVGIDLDRHHGGPDGIAAFTALCATHGQPWPNTLTVRTPHGLHLYFRIPAERIIGSTSGGRAGMGPGIDTRGPGRRSGGYLVGPGSIVDGIQYVVEHDTSIQRLPAWLANLLDSAGDRNRRGERPPETACAGRAVRSFRLMLQENRGPGRCP